MSSFGTANTDELFRPFEQRGADRTGLGLGLAFSRWGAQANDGRVYTRNIPGKGCVFTLDMPRVAAPAVTTAPQIDPEYTASNRLRCRTLPPLALADQTLAEGANDNAGDRVSSFAVDSNSQRRQARASRHPTRPGDASGPYDGFTGGRLNTVKITRQSRQSRI